MKHKTEIYEKIVNIQDMMNIITGEFDAIGQGPAEGDVDINIHHELGAIMLLLDEEEDED